MDISSMTWAVSSATRLEIVKYIIVASAAVLVFDYFLTLEMEVKHIWPSRLNACKAIYLYTRYSAFIDVPLTLYYALAPGVSYELCYNIHATVYWSTAIGIGVTELIMILRAYALWGNNRRILVFLLSCLTFGSISVFVILVLFLRSLKYGESPFPTAQGCYLTEASYILFADFAILMVTELIIIALTIWIGVKQFRYCRNALLITLYRDGTSYFVYLFLISATNVAVLVAGPPDLFDILTFQRVMHSILAARVVLHLRETADTDVLYNEDWE